MLWSEYNNTLRMTHCCSNDSISRIQSINLLDSLELAHQASWAYFPSLWKQIYYFLNWGGFNDVVDVDELICHRQQLTVSLTGAVVVVVSGIPWFLWLCFIGVLTDCVSSSFFYRCQSLLWWLGLIQVKVAYGKL